MQVNPREVRALDDLSLVIRIVGGVRRGKDLRVVELVDAVAQILVHVILGYLVSAVTAVLGHHQVLLVLLLEQLLVDLGDVLRYDLRVRVRMSDGRRHGLEIVV